MRQVRPKFMNISEYKKNSQMVFYSLIGMAAMSLITAIVTAVVLAGSVFAILSGDFSGFVWIILCALLTLTAYIFYFIGLTGFTKLYNGTPDEEAMGKVRLAALLALIGVGCTIIPIAGVIINFILSIISAIFLIIGWNTLKSSTTFQVPQAANLIFIAAIVSLCGAVLAIIPVVGIIGSLAGLAAFILQVIAWAQIMNYNFSNEQPQQYNNY